MLYYGFNGGRIASHYPLRIMQVTLNLTPMQLICLQDAISLRYHDLSSTVNNIDIYPDQPADNPQRVTALRELHLMLDQY